MKKALFGIAIFLALILYTATGYCQAGFVDASAAPTSSGTDVTIISATGPAGASYKITYLALVNTGAVTVYFGLGVAGSSVGNTPGTDGGLASGDSITFAMPLPGVKSIGLRTASSTGAIDIFAVVE